MQWSGNALVGFRADENNYEESSHSGSNASSIACSNPSDSPWMNILYPLCELNNYNYITIVFSTLIHSSLPFLLSDQRNLQFLQMGVTSNISRAVLYATSGVSARIDIPQGFPFGHTSHTSLYVR